MLTDLILWAQVQRTPGSPHSGSSLISLVAHNHPPSVPQPTLSQELAALPGASLLEGASPTYFPFPKHHQIPWGPELLPRNYTKLPKLSCLRKVSGTELYRHTPPTKDLPTWVLILPFKSPVFSATPHKMQSPQLVLLLHRHFYTWCGIIKAASVFSHLPPVTRSEQQFTSN